MSVWARVVDRVRPWRAPTPSAAAPTAIVVGAGPAGLATAALLRRRGVRAVVVDRGDVIGDSWARRYESLRLNTVRWMSDLPGYRMPRPLGRWVGRDQIVEYLGDYARHHRLECRLCTEVTGLEPSSGGWTVEVGDGPETVAGVVVATGHSREPFLPEWAADGLDGRIIHAADYRRPGDHTGRQVLVVGAGSSGGEICVDLVAGGVPVSWAVRSAPQVFPREVFGLPTTPFAPIGDTLPDGLVDRAAPWIERRIHGRRDYLPAPEAPMMRLLAACKEPMTADGIVDAVRDGRVRVVAAVDRLTACGAELVDGTSVTADDVIVATGYRAGLDRLVGHLDVLDATGRPRSLLPRRGLGFVGYRVPLTGTLWAIEGDARRVAAGLLG